MVTAEDYNEVPEVCAVTKQPDMNAVLKNSRAQENSGQVSVKVPAIIQERGY